MITNQEDLIGKACPWCGCKYAATQRVGGGQPKIEPGTLLFCLACGGINMLSEDLQLARATPEVLASKEPATVQKLYPLQRLIRFGKSVNP